MPLGLMGSFLNPLAWYCCDFRMTYRVPQLGPMIPRGCSWMPAGSLEKLRICYKQRQQQMLWLNINAINSFFRIVFNLTMKGLWYFSPGNFLPWDKMPFSSLIFIVRFELSSHNISYWKPSSSIVPTDLRVFFFPTVNHRLHFEVENLLVHDAVQ